MSNTALMHPQLRHSLIPQAHSAEDDQVLAQTLKDFRAKMFHLFQTKVDAVASDYSEATDQARLYLKVRHALDDDVEIGAVHQQRGTLQDTLWAKVLADIEADQARLDSVYQSHCTGPGGLELNPDLDIPEHQRKTDIHRMPGGYVSDRDSDSIRSGVLYDHGVFLYGRGWLGPLNDELGQTLIHHVLAPHFPELVPRKILDLGCAVGHSTLPYTAAFPAAQVWGIDLGASLLRYAIARARVLDQTVYFAQQNAEHTEFPDQSFDLVVSHILLHEIPAVARQRVFAESYRLLQPGGLMVHLESQLFLKPPTLVARYFRDTEVWTNAEPYLGSSRFEDFPTYALAAGFAPADFQMYAVPGYYSAQNGNTSAGWIAFCGSKR